MNGVMKMKLQIDEGEHEAFLSTHLLYSKVCNYISEENFKRGKITNNYRLHNMLYDETRKAIPEAASQIVIKAISRVAQSYKVSIPAQENARKITEK